MTFGTIRPYLFFITMFLSISLGYSQSNSERAKQKYFQAEQAYAEGDYKQSLSYLDQAQQLLGDRYNPRLEVFYVRIYGITNDYENIELHLDRYFSVANSDNSAYNEMLLKKDQLETIKAEQSEALKNQKIAEVERDKYLESTNDEEVIMISELEEWYQFKKDRMDGGYQSIKVVAFDMRDMSFMDQISTISQEVNYFIHSIRAEAGGIYRSFVSPAVMSYFFEIENTDDYGSRSEALYQGSFGNEGLVYYRRLFVGTNTVSSSRKLKLVEKEFKALYGDIKVTRYTAVIGDYTWDKMTIELPNKPNYKMDFYAFRPTNDKRVLYHLRHFYYVGSDEEKNGKTFLGTIELKTGFSDENVEYYYQKNL